MKEMKEIELTKATGVGAALAVAGGDKDFVFWGYFGADNNEPVEPYTDKKNDCISLKELVKGVKATGSRFFSPNNLGFFGDTFANYYIRDGGDVWVLCRKEPVHGGQTGESYFKKDTFERVFK